VSTATVVDRVLDRLPVPRWLGIAAWACAPLVSLVVYTTAIRSSGHTLDTHEFLDLLATQAVLAYACLVFLLGTAMLVRQAAVVRRELAAGGHDRPTDLFQRIESIRGPLVLTTPVALVITASGWTRYGPVPPLAALPFVVVYLLPILTFVWTFLRILFDLDRLGRQRLSLRGFPADRSLGLEAVGSLASTGLGLLLIASVPVLFAGADQPVTLSISLVLVAACVALFVLSMWRIHRQMARVKDQLVEMTQALYTEAYAPIEREGRVETLERQSGALRAAQSLDERAHNVLTWPINEGTVKFIAVVITSVVTSLIVRALFAALGF
jgi:hypothetical protein